MCQLILPKGQNSDGAVSGFASRKAAKGPVFAGIFIEVF